MAAHRSLAAKLYHGEASYDFVGHRYRYYILSGVLIVISLLSLWFRGLTYGVEFEGGAVFTVQAPGATISDAASAIESSGVDVGEPIITEIGEDRLRIQTPTMTPDQSSAIQNALAEELNVERTDVTSQVVGSTWGGEITKKAVTGLIVFLILVVLYLSFAFEWKLALSAIIALLHDLVVTAGIYSLVGFEVTPATVIGLLTILGYSLYDTVVVYDKVRENTRGIAGSSRWSYDQAANLAINQTLVRSINTTVVALLPVAGLLVGGVFLVGSGALKDLALVLLIGIFIGAYSSIFIATPLAVQFKLTEPALKAQQKRVLARQSHGDVGPARPARRTSSSKRATAAADGFDDVDDEDFDGADIAVEKVATSARSKTAAKAKTTTARVARPVAPTGGRSQPKRSSKSKRSGGKRR